MSDETRDTFWKLDDCQSIVKSVREIMEESDAEEEFLAIILTLEKAKKKVTPL